MNDSFKTPKGTELPLLNLKGKQYLQVAHRLVWFREECPEWTISTEFVQLSENHAIAKATISFQSTIIATAHKCEDRKGFADFMEKAETGAIGRALAHCGYGTQFAPELDEKERIVDSPTARQKPAANNAVPTQNKPIVGGATKPTRMQLAQLFELAHHKGWTDDYLRGYLDKMGLKGSDELTWFQWNDLMKKIETYPMNGAT